MCVDNGSSTGGRLWFGLVSIIWNTIHSHVYNDILQGTGLLRVYDMDHYYLESDTKITDCTQKTSTRLVYDNLQLLCSLILLFVSLHSFLSTTLCGQALSTEPYIYWTLTPAQVCEFVSICFHSPV